MSEPLNPRRPWRATVGFLIRRYGSALGFALLCVYFSFATPDHTFTRPQNLLNITDQVAANLILATGMTLVIVSGGIDLSVGSVLAFGGTVSGGVLAHGMASGEPVGTGLVMLAVLCGMGIGALSGLLNGFIIARFRIRPFIATLAMMLVARGLANVYVQGGRFGNLPDLFTSIGRGRVGPIPQTAVVACVIALVGHLVLKRTAFGRWIYAMGGNEEAARLSGIPIAHTKLIVYTVCGLLAAVGGVLSASTLGAGDPTTGYYAELDAIAAVVLGGASLSGGMGSVGGTVLGALLIGVLNNGLALLKVDEFWQLVARGTVILGAMILDQMTKRDT